LTLVPVPAIATVLPAPLLVVLVAVPILVAVAVALRSRSVRRELEQGRQVAERARADAEFDRHEAIEARTRLERALDGIPQAVLITDADGEVVVRNHIAESFADARHSDALVEAAIDELLDEALAGRDGHRTIELFGPPKRTLVIVTTPLPDGALAVVDDISERRRLDATRRDFVANISHELKTPVGAMGLLAEALLAEDDLGVARRLAERLLNEAFRLDRTIEDLLVLSRIEGEEDPVHAPVPVRRVMADAGERIGPAAEQAGIVIHVTVPDEPLAIQGDRPQLVSALYNLLDNAVKYSDDGDTVEVRVAALVDQVVIEVQDHGIGIPKADLERVFERFYRVDQARSRTTGGTGLGLAIVRHVATNHAGQLQVESRLGEGSTFTLLLPRAVDEVSDTEAFLPDPVLADPVLTPRPPKKAGIA
jgi:two-component system sensor histidine kinase SenX3